MGWAIEWLVAQMAYVVAKSNLVQFLDAYTISAEDYDTLTSKYLQKAAKLATEYNIFAKQPHHHRQPQGS